MKIRPLTPNDLPAVARLYLAAAQQAYAAFYPPHLLAETCWQETLAEYRSWYAWPYPPLGSIAEEDGNLLGFGMGGRIEQDPNELEAPLGYDSEIYKLFVHPQQQRRGIGKALLRDLGQRIAALGCKRILIWSYTQSASTQYYQALGGKIIRQTTYNPGGIDLPVCVLGWQLTDLLAAVSPRP